MNTKQTWSYVYGSLLIAYLVLVTFFVSLNINFFQVFVVIIMSYSKLLGVNNIYRIKVIQIWTLIFKFIFIEIILKAFFSIIVLRIWRVGTRRVASCKSHLQETGDAQQCETAYSTVCDHGRSAQPVQLLDRQEK